MTHAHACSRIPMIAIVHVIGSNSADGAEYVSIVKLLIQQCQEKQLALHHEDPEGGPVLLMEGLTPKQLEMYMPIIAQAITTHVQRYKTCRILPCIQPRYYINLSQFRDAIPLIVSTLCAVEGMHVAV